MIRFNLLLLSFLLSFSSFSQLENYKIYTAKGKEVNYDKMLKSLKKSEVILFGELHNNVIAHWLELELLKSLSTDNNLAIGLEMFERDNEEVLQLYLEDSLNKEAFDSLVRFWSNYDTDYAPLLNYAKDNNIPFHATNIPRRYASLVYKQDFSALDSLNTNEKSWMAPLPIVYYDTLAQYQAILKMMGEHGSPNLVKAQAMKDATMAHFILKVMSDNEVDKILHFNGSFHSNYFEGIYWYLKHYMESIEISTICVVEQENIESLSKENLSKANFTIVVDSDFPKSY